MTWIQTIGETNIGVASDKTDQLINAVFPASQMFNTFFATRVKGFIWVYPVLANLSNDVLNTLMIEVGLTKESTADFYPFEEALEIAQVNVEAAQTDDSRQVADMRAMRRAITRWPIGPCEAITETTNVMRSVDYSNGLVRINEKLPGRIPVGPPNEGGGLALMFYAHQATVASQWRIGWSLKLFGGWKAVAPPK